VNERAGWLAGVGIALAVIGVWGAWVPHRAAGLVLSGWDLAEYVKFLPGNPAIRELFYLPVCCAGVALSLWANHRAARLAPRIGLTGAAVALVSTVLPPYPHVFDGFRIAEFRWQFILSASAVLLILAGWFSARWPARVSAGLLLAGALVGAFPALWQFLNIRDDIASLYGSGLGWGWGLVLFLTGWALVGLIGIRRLQIPESVDR
jgi:hypothetical protein